MTPEVRIDVPDGELAGRVALVTGGSRGIGREVCRELAAAGADIGFSYRRDASAAADLEASLIAQNRRAIGVQADVASDPLGPVDAVIAAFGRLDILVSNAGVASRGLTVAETTQEELERVIAVHAVGPHQLCRAALPYLRRQERSDIVFISSNITSIPMAGGGPYGMGKAAVEALAKTIAREERESGIRVNVIAPGVVDTEMGNRLVRAQGASSMREVDARSPFGRVCAPSDVARLVRFLVGPAGAYVNDQRINLDGGAF